jgi:SAM-dependent methyltransferase
MTRERNARDAEAIWRLLALQPGQLVLDIGCGHGRITNELASHGVHVTGLDAMPPFLSRARERAASLGVDVEYVQGDMRRIPWQSRFDAVLLWYTTFGYFDDAENAQVLQDAASALKPGGRLLIEQINRVALLQQGVPSSHVIQRGDDLMIDLVDYDPMTDRAQTERVIVRDGRVKRVRFSVRLYGLGELATLLRSVGFGSVQPFGPDGKPFTLYGRRLGVVAKK